MTDTEKKIAEIREALEMIDRGDFSEIGEAHGKAGEWLRFLLDELEQTRKESNMLREELHKFQELAIKATNHHKAERDKLVDGLRWYAATENWRLSLTHMLNDGGKRARDILREIGVTVE